MKVRGEYLILVRDADTLHILREIRVKNVVTTAFLNILSQAVRDTEAFCFIRPALHAGGVIYEETAMRKYWYIVLGTGTGTPSSSDTGLFEPVDITARHGTISADGNVVTYSVRYLPEEINGNTYTEIGVYDLITGRWTQKPPGSGQYIWEWYDYTAGTLLSHAMIDPPITKTEDILLDCYAQITFS